MRVLMVSALFPHTVFTGGTSVPLYQAAALRALGHDVHLFGGHISHLPGRSSERSVVSGFPATLVDVAGMLHPQSPEFFANPRAEREFTKVLDIGFDIVHLHSLQGLGAGLVEIAHAAGARIIVQMHDFYWVCDRQFLLTESLSPCSGLTQPGCECRLPAQAPSARSLSLHLADVLLVPTNEMRLWLANIGLDVSRVHVGGWPDPHLPTSATDTDWNTSTPYLLYLGGASGEKGWPTLLEAAWGDGSGQLRVLCPGVAPGAIPGELQSILEGGPKAPRDEISRLMRDACGVVVPSLAAETFSYVAREALGLGTPVVITDGPGGVDCAKIAPELVHLVPRGRSDHLRSAMSMMLSADRRSMTPHPPAPGPDLGTQLLGIYASAVEGAA